MSKNRLGKGLDVVRDHELAAEQGRSGLGPVEQVQGSPRAGAKCYLGVIAGPLDQLRRIVAQLGLHEDLANRLLGGLQLGRRHHRLQLQKGRLDLVLTEQLRLLPGAEVAQPHLHEEAIELGLGQREGAGVLDRVLGRHHHERLGQVVRLAVDGDLPLLHCLQQRGLGLWGGAVDLVGEQNLAEHRARPEFEVVRALVEGANTGDIRGQQVRGELNAAKGAVEGAGKGLREHGLADTGHVLDQEVPMAEKGDQAEPDLILLVNDRPADVGGDRIGDPADDVESGFVCLSQSPTTLRIILRPPRSQTAANRGAPD